MSFFGSIFERRSVITGGTPDVLDGFWYGIAGGASKSGQSVNRSTAMRQKTVYACVSLIAETLAQLPLKLKKTLPDGSNEDAVDHPLFDILKNQPNPEMTSFTWRETGQSHILLNGNKYSWIERSRLGIKGLWPIDPQRVTVKRTKNSADVGMFDTGRQNRIIYEVQSVSGTQKIPARDMLHVPGLGFNGLVGISVVQDFAKDTIGLGLSLDEFQSLYFVNGLAVSGTFQHPATLGENKESFLAALKAKYSNGFRKSHVPMVLENGMEWKPLKASLADQQFIELQKLTALDICGIYKVPPAKIGIHNKGANYNNTEQQNKSFLDTTMLQWIVRDEQAMNAKLLTAQERADGYFVKYNFDALLRPDSKTRAEISQIEFSMGVPTNTLLRRDDRPPVEGGDIGRVPMNFVRVDQETIEPVVPAARSCNHGESGVASSLVELRKKQTRSIAGRDRVARAWGPVIRKTVQRVVNREATAVKRATKKARNNRADADLEKFLDTFYRDMAVIIDNEMRPVLDGFMRQARDMVAGEVGAGEITEEFEKFMSEYTDGYVRQYIDSSKGQLIELVREKGLDAVDERADEWTEKRADKEEFKESNTVPNAAAYAVMGAMGLNMTWALRGPTTCPYCKSMEGKKVRAGGSFLDAGTNLDPEGGTGPMLIKGTTRFPQLHSKCDCFLLPG